MRTARLLALLTGLSMLCWPQASPAHWCSNIYQTYARIVVKPERDRLDVAVGETAQLQVRVRNNFPYTLHYIKLRAQAPDALEVAVSPSERAAEQHPVVAGEEVTFVLQITRLAEGPDEIDVLDLQVNTTVEDVEPRWRDQSDTWVAPAPTEEQIREHQDLGLHQARALTWYKLTELGCPGCERDGVAGLVELYSARLDPCAPGGFDSPMAMQFIRAGHQLAVRLRFSDFVEADRDEVVGHMRAAMDDANPIARGFAAFLSAYGAADQVTERIRAMADSDPDGACAFEPDPRARRMATAALLITGDDAHRDGVVACAADEGEHPRVRATCAAALGVMGEDAPVVETLLGLVPDGKDMSYDRMFASYLLQLVVFERRGGPNADAVVSFLDETPYPEPPPDKGGCSTGGAPAGGLALLIMLWMLLRASRARHA